MSISLVTHCSAQVMLARHRSPTKQKTPQSTATIDRVFQNLGSEFVKSSRSDGLSIAVVTESGPQFFNFGTVSRVEPKTPTEQTIYEIGSITKVFTSLLLAHAVTEGKVSLHDDIRKYLPENYSNLSYHGAPIHLVDLADSTSALPENLPDVSAAAANANPDQVPFLILEASQRYTNQQLLEDLRSTKLLGRPGTVPRHSNLATALLAIILERVYGDTFENLLSRYVEKPFQITSGTGPFLPQLLALGYNERHIAMPPLDARSVLAAGGLRYSTSDMARFLTAELHASDAAMRLSQKPAWGDLNTNAVAFNWTLTRMIDSKRRLQASGGTFGFSSYLEMYPDLGYGVVMLANRPGETQDQLRQLAEIAFAEIHGKPGVQSALEQALEAGSYRNVGAIVARVRRIHPDLNLTEEYVNNWGGQLLATNPQRAASLFAYNTEQWPTSWNAFDSLAEAYEQLGNTKEATIAYQRSLVLNPGNDHAKEQLSKLFQH